MPQRASPNIEKLVRNAKLNTLISKIMISVFIIVFGAAVFLPLTNDLNGFQIPQELSVVGTVSAFLAALFFLIAIMGLQVSTSFFSSDVIGLLNPLPLSKKDVSRVALLCFLRVFDVPLAVAIVVFPTAYALFSRSALGGLAAVLSVGVTEIFALALTVGLAKFFYSRIAAGGGKSTWRALLRVVLMLVWILPSFGAYIVINFWMPIMQFSASLTQSAISVSYFIAVLYPFAFGFLVSYASFTVALNSVASGLSIIASLCYLGVAFFCTRWVGESIRNLKSSSFGAASNEPVRDVVIRPRAPWLGVIQKDLRVASRSPSYASIFLLPAIQTIILAVSFSSFEELGISETLGLLTGISFMTVLVPPTLFAIEGLASAYARSLPLRSRTLIFAKTVLATLTYVVSLIAMFIAMLLQGRDISSVLIFGGVHLLTVMAANLLETLLLVDKFWKEGSAIGNIYARLSTYVLILLPGAFAIFMPIFAAIAATVFAPDIVLPVFLLSAMLEFAIVATAALLTNRRQSDR